MTLKDKQFLIIHRCILYQTLESIAATLMRESPNLCITTQFSKSWKTFTTHIKNLDQIFSIHPLIHEWLLSAHVMIRNHIHVRYPQSHIARLLLQFGNILLNFCNYLQTNTEGKVCLLGNPVLYIFESKYTIIFPKDINLNAINWRIDHDELIFENENKVKYIRISRSNQNIIDANISIQIEKTKNIGSIIIDSSINETYFHKINNQFQGLLQNMNEKFSAHINLMKLSNNSNWCAGVINIIPLNDKITDFEFSCLLLNNLFRDLTERAWDISSLHEDSQLFILSSELRIKAIRASCKYLVNKYFNMENTTDTDNWESIKSTLNKSKSGDIFLNIISSIENRNKNLLHNQDTVKQNIIKEIKNKNDILFIPKEILRSNYFKDYIQPLLVKTRKKGFSFKENDWSFIDKLSLMDNKAVKYILNLINECTLLTEEVCYIGATGNYVVGEYKKCINYINKCLEFDKDVEEYTCLLAFAFRYSGNIGQFNNFIFNKN